MTGELNYLSLFSGIGGLDLGLDRAGWNSVGQVEREPYCQRVLAKHWPEVPRHDDVRTAPDWWAARPRPAVRLVAGGFPCQPFSTAGSKKGIADERWGWPWFWDVVRLVRPEYVLVENVAALLRDRDAFGIILADLATGGYDADWDCIPAAAVGAPHLRDRVFLVAHSEGGRRGGGSAVSEPTGRRAVAHSAGRGPDVADAFGMAGPPAGERRVFATAPARWSVGGTDGRSWSSGQQWAAEPDVGRVAHGVPARMDRLRGLGNAVVPQVAEHVGQLIREHAERLDPIGAAP